MTMTPDLTRAIIGITIVIGFFGFVGVVLFGYVNVLDPTIAKLVGLMFGYIGGLLQPVILVYFGQPPAAPPPTVE